MSAQSPWRPSYSPNPDEPIEIHEELDSPPRRRWPLVLVALVALITGLGLGNVAGTSARDLDRSVARLDARTSELRVAQAGVDRAWARAEQMRQNLSVQSRQRATAEDGLEAFAREAAALAGHPATDVGPGQVGVLRAWLGDLEARDGRALRASYAADVRLTITQNGVLLEEVAGVGQVVAAVRQALPSSVHATTRVLQRGQFAAAGYSTPAMSGVIVVHAVDGSITSQWVYVDRRW